ncbi:MAG: hypothetical protein AAF205_03190 [Pseudomonadota bacterium]
MTDHIILHEFGCADSQRAAFNALARDTLLPAVMKGNGVTGVFLFETDPRVSGRGDHLLLTRLNLAGGAVDAETALAAYTARLKGLADLPDLAFEVWAPILLQGVARRSNPLPDNAAELERWIVLVETDPNPGVADDYNDWYSDHLSDALKTPDYLSASRYRMADPQPGRSEYLCIYEICTDDILRTRRIRRDFKNKELAEGNDHRPYMRHPGDEFGNMPGFWQPVLLRQKVAVENNELVD